MSSLRSIKTEGCGSRRDLFPTRHDLLGIGAMSVDRSRGLILLPHGACTKPQGKPVKRISSLLQIQRSSSHERFLSESVIYARFGNLLKNA